MKGEANIGEEEKEREEACCTQIICDSLPAFKLSRKPPVSCRFSCCTISGIPKAFLTATCLKNNTCPIENMLDVTQ